MELIEKQRIAALVRKPKEVEEAKNDDVWALFVARLAPAQSASAASRKIFRLQRRFPSFLVADAATPSPFHHHGQERFAEGAVCQAHCRRWPGLAQSACRSSAG